MRGNNTDIPAGVVSAGNRGSRVFARTPEIGANTVGDVGEPVRYLTLNKHDSQHMWTAPHEMSTHMATASREIFNSALVVKEDFHRFI